MSTCKQQHRHWPFLESLPHDQGGYGRHKCAGCAYELGYQAGARRDERLHIDLDSLPESQAGTVRHRSPMPHLLRVITTVYIHLTTVAEKLLNFVSASKSVASSRQPAQRFGSQLAKS